MGTIEVTDEQLLKAVEAAGVVAVGHRLEQNGRVALTNTHEILLAVTDDMSKLVELIKQDNSTDVPTALANISATCIFALGSLWARGHSNSVLDQRSFINAS